MSNVVHLPIRNPRKRTRQPATMVLAQTEPELLVGLARQHAAKMKNAEAADLLDALSVALAGALRRAAQLDSELESVLAVSELHAEWYAEGWTKREAAGVLWRAGMLQEGEIVADGVARLLETLDRAPVAARALVIGR